MKSIASIVVLPCVLCALCGNLFAAEIDVDKVAQQRLDEYKARYDAAVAKAKADYAAQLAVLGEKLLALKPVRIDWADEVAKTLKDIDREAANRLRANIIKAKLKGGATVGAVKEKKIWAKWILKHTHKGHREVAIMRIRRDGSITLMLNDVDIYRARWSAQKNGSYKITCPELGLVMVVRFDGDKLIGTKTAAKNPKDKGTVVEAKLHLQQW